MAIIFKSKFIKPKVTRWQKSLSIKNIAKLPCFIVRKLQKHCKTLLCHKKTSKKFEIQLTFSVVF